MPFGLSRWIVHTNDVAAYLPYGSRKFRVNLQLPNVNRVAHQTCAQKLPQSRRTIAIDKDMCTIGFVGSLNDGTGMMSG